MKQKALSLALVLTALAGSIFTPSARAEIEVSFDYFQDALSPFGEWIEVGDYGLCWRPTGVGADWAPYTDGYWAYTDAGWTWVSYEDWGGITYHYGRWVHVRDEGWVWVPEYQWGPAWVSWRSNDDYVGWAPLPPEARWEQDTGFSTWVDTSYDIGPDNYRFCHTHDFGSPFLAPVLLPCERNVTIIQSTVNITNVSFNHVNAVIFNGGPNFVTINAHCRRPIPSLRLLIEDHAVRDVHGHAPPQVLRGNELAVFAPKVTRPVDIKALPVQPRRVVAADKINRGWGRVPEPAAQQEIRKKLGRQSEGLTPATAPARPPRAEELSNIPKKADPNAPSPGALGKSKPPRNPNAVASTPQVSPLLGQPIPPKPPRPIIDPPPQVNPSEPTPKVPQVGVAERPGTDRPANPVKPFQPKAQPIKNPPIERPQRPPQAEAVPPSPSQPQRAAVDENARAAEKALRKQQREQQARDQATENAQRVAETTRRRQESVQRSNESRPQPQRPQAQQADAARQQQEAAQRANDVRNQQAQQQRQQARQAEASRQSQDAAQRANEIRSQQVQQQRQQARQADVMRQQQETSQRANETRNLQAQQQRQQAQQADMGRRQQEAAQRANEMRHQQMQQQQRQAPQQVEVARRQQPPPPQAQPAAQSSGSSGKDGDDDKKKHRAR